MSLRSTGVTDSLAAEHVLELNQNDDSNQLCGLFLRHGSDGYSIYVLGKAGEPCARKITLSLQHEYVKNEIDVLLDIQSDNTGRVFLGRLPHITHVNAKLFGPSGETIQSMKWELTPTAIATFHSEMRSVEGEEISIPFCHITSRISTDASLDDVVLLEEVKGSYKHNLTNTNLRIDNKHTERSLVLHSLKA